MSEIRKVIVLSLLTLFELSNAATNLDEGDTCTREDGSQGICKLFTDCASTYKRFTESGKFPDVKLRCGFKETQVIVCCEQESKAETTTTTTTTTTKRTTQTQRKASTRKPDVSVSATSREPGEISKQKCKEYAQYAYERKQSPTLSAIPQTSNTLECAFDRLELIAGGTLASRQEFPHMVLVGYQTGDNVEWSCGGSIISENYVLTAAHCLKSQELGPAALVRVGITNQTDTRNMQERNVEQIIAYPDYITKYHDIGLLRLSENINFNTYVRPACLHTKTDIPYEKAIACGWGRINSADDRSNDLLKVVLELYDVEKCTTTYKKRILNPRYRLSEGIISRLMICAGSSRDIKDTCEGDSGGPLQIYHPDTDEHKCMYEIIGITAFGISCASREDRPGVYTRVSNYVKWIEDIVWPN